MGCSTLPVSARATRPEVAPPANPCDSHARVFGPADRYPVPKIAAIRPPDARKILACCMRSALRPESVVQGGAHGRDNTSMLDGGDWLHPRASITKCQMPGAPIQAASDVDTR